MLWNGLTFRQAIALEIAKLYNIQAIFIENGTMPNRITIDKKGVNFLNSVPRNKSFYQQYSNENILPTSLIPRIAKNSKKFKKISCEDYLPKNYIFVPFQVDYDTQIMLYSPWIKNMTQLFEVIEQIAQELNIHFVFKEHPTSVKNYPTLHKRASKNPNLYFANGCETQTLIENANAVITINSTVGIESLLFGKKVITLGNSYYNIEEIVLNVQTKDKLKLALKNLSSWKPNSVLVNNFLKYLYYDYLVEGNFIDYSEKQIEQIQNILS